MKTINFALIGCGRIAGRHIEAISACAQAKLIAVCDMNVERARDKSTMGNVPYFLNYHDMLEQFPEIDVVIILTPSGAHFEHAMDMVNVYQKNLLIEKPFVLTTTQAQRLKRAADQNDVTIFPLYQNRFNKAVQKVKTAMTGQELGALRVGTVRVRWCRPQRYYDMSPWRGTWAMDGGAMTNQGIHYIDLLRYLCGEVKRVHAKLGSLGAKIEVEDTGVAILEFANGGLGVIEIMTSARPDDFEASISCVCENGMAIIGGIATNVLQTFTPDQTQAAQFSEEFPTVYGFGHDVIIQSVVDTLLLNQPPLIEFDDGLKTLKLLHALYKSDERNGWVEVDEAGDSARLGVPDEALSELYRATMNVEA
ncbi:MAG: Gfo/Idh/MocA family oxidoreductase [Pseudomonadota bacterium]